MKKVYLFLIILLVFQLDLMAQNITVGTTLYDPNVTDGYVLIAPTGRTDSYLVDNCGRVVNSWNSSSFPALYNYLHTDAKLYRAIRVNNSYIPTAGLGGRFERYDWFGLLDWHFEYTDSTYTPHHDFVVLPNGNIIFIFIEVKTVAEAQAAGRDLSLLNSNVLWSEALMEIEPLGTDSARVVWEWHTWDHLIQEFDPTTNNYGSVAQHPELIDLNYALLNNTQDWLHANSISYNATLDQLAISIRNTNEIWVIDHSTTTAEAAGHTGGDAGRGGDLLYRWGNSETYQVNANHTFEAQHDVTWVGDTSLMVYNNAPFRGYSSIELIHLPLLANGTYNFPALGQAFAPSLPNWTYDLSPSASSGRLSSAQRLANGHTLVCSGNQGYIFELDAQDSIVWEYKNPATATGILSQGDLNFGSNQLFKARRYLANDPRFNGLNTTPANPIEQNFSLTLCPLNSSIQNLARPKLKLWPQPASNYIVLQAPKPISSISIYSINGKLVWQKNNIYQEQLKIETASWAKGTYIIESSEYTPLLFYKIN